MKKIMLFSALFLTYINLLAAQPTDVEKWLIKGNEYYDQKEYNKAIEAYTQVINIRLNEEKAAEERAKKQSANRDFYSFRRTWTGKEITAYLYRGKSYYKIKNYDAAIKDYLVVKKNYDPSYYQIYVSLGDAYGANGQYNEAYINYKKYDGRIKTYKTEKGIVVKAVKDKSLKDEEIIQIKNKIFEKIRKQIDDYNKYDYNYIFAEIVFTAYEELEHFEKLSKEINFLISHLDAIWGNAEYHLILKVGNHWADFDLRRGEYKVL